MWTTLMQRLKTNHFEACDKTSKLIQARKLTISMAIAIDVFGPIYCLPIARAIT